MAKGQEEKFDFKPKEEEAVDSMLLDSEPKY